MTLMNKLNRREQYTVCIGLAFVVIFIVMQFGVFPLMERKQRAEKRLARKQQEIVDITEMQAQYGRLRSDSEQWKKKVETRPKEFTLFSFMERLAKESGMNIAYMKPSRSVVKDSPYAISRVEIKLQEISLKQLTEYLYKVETSTNLILVERISITKKEKSGFMDVILKVQTYEA